MFIEDEADAVFNEIRNQRKDSDDKEEEITTNDPVTPAVRETKAASPGPAPMITIKVDVLSDSIELEEPVSPPACHPSEGPPLLFSSQSIEVRNKYQQYSPSSHLSLSLRTLQPSS